MAIDLRAVSKYLDLAVTSLTPLVTLFSGEAGVVASYVLAALKMGSDYAAAGQDPVTVIERIHSAQTDLSDVEDSWQAGLNEAFGSESITPAAPFKKPSGAHPAVLPPGGVSSGPTGAPPSTVTTIPAPAAPPSKDDAHEADSPDVTRKLPTK